MACRNEDWIIGLSARAVLMWVDHLIVLDHASIDNTAGLLLDLAVAYLGRVTILNERDPQWNEMAHRQRMLEAARGLAATHIAYVDADEVLTGNALSTIRAFYEQLARGVILQLPWLAMRDSLTRYHSSGQWANQYASSVFRDDPRLHWTTRDGYDFHQRNPMGLNLRPYRPLEAHQGGLMHLQFVSARRLKAKQYLYQLTERLRWPDREPVDAVRSRYSLAVYGAPKAEAGISGLVEHFGVARAAAIVREARRLNPQLSQVDAPEPIQDFAEGPAEWWAPYSDLMRHLHVDAEPWQLAEARKILREHPGIEEGLDNFGLEL